MMKKRIVGLLLLVNACSYSPDLGPSDIDLTILDRNWSSCRTTYSAGQTQVELVGTWRLIANGCGECSWSGLRKTTDDVRLVITNTQRVQLYRQGQLTTEAAFTLPQSQYGSATLETGAHAVQNVTRGPIEFCQMVVAFRDDYRDGLSHYFIRTDN